MGIKIYNRFGLLKDKFAEMSDDRIANEIAEKLAEKGEEIAKANYSSQSIKVSHNKAVDGNAKIVAQGEGIAYMEFGTGVTGDGTYPDKKKLPTETLSFESPKGHPQTTQGWVYNYPNRYTKILGGWFFGNTFTTGQPAKAQMFYTHRTLQKEYVKIAKSVIKENKK